MKRKTALLILFLISVNTSYSQLDDIFKKIPGVGDVFEEAVTTNIKDAYPTAFWLKDLDKQIEVQKDAEFSYELSPGYYKFGFNTFCLHAGKYGPTGGAGYLVAPLKGSKAILIKNILTRYQSHQDIDQKDVQLLLWGIESGQKFSKYSPDFQLRVQPLLTPDEIALIDVNIKEITIDFLPDEIKEVLNTYSNIRSKLSDPNSTYEDVENIAVRTGIAPPGKGSRNIEEGSWSSIGNGVYLRCFPHGYKKTDVEIYIPAEVNIQKDNSGNITNIDNGSYKIMFNYEEGVSKFKSAVITNNLSAEETTIENNSDETEIKKQTAEFINLVKKSIGKKRAKFLTGESLKILEQLKIIELSLINSNDKNAYILSLNALNSHISGIEHDGKKGGKKNSAADLSNISGLVFAPGMTTGQRLGNGGPEGGPPKKDKECKPEITIHEIDKNYLPEPNTSFNVGIEIKNLTDKCKIEAVKFTLFSVSRELGRCLNDKDPNWYDTRLDFFIDPVMNGAYTVSADSLSAEISGRAVNITVSCNDYGAYGRIKAEVKINGTWYYAKDENVYSAYILLPNDKGNSIADSWEEANNVSLQPADSDNDTEPVGQKKNGDGITNYEEYRGFFASKTQGGIIEHIRTDPTQKELFVIDEGHLLSKKAWETSTFITVYFLTEKEVYGNLAGNDKDDKYRWVDFCRGYAKGNKYAINIIKVDGLTDPYKQYEDPKTAFAYAMMTKLPGSPKDCSKLVVIRARVVLNVTTDRDKIASILSKTSADPIDYFGWQIPRNDAQNFVNYLNVPAQLSIFVDYQMTLTMIHEMGHACGTSHHGGGDSTKTGTGAEWCPMRYIGPLDKIKWISIIPTFSSKDDFNSWIYCTPPDVDNCWGQLNVNDK